MHLQNIQCFKQQQQKIVIVFGTRNCMSMHFTSYITIQVRSSGHGRAGIGRSTWKGLTRDATRRLRFVVHAARWLHSMVLHGSRKFKTNIYVRNQLIINLQHNNTII